VNTKRPEPGTGGGAELPYGSLAAENILTENPGHKIPPVKKGYEKSL